eukprot:NODE_2598_length_538_cov_16.579075_g2548_i0.p1 GENE.NODE_2598_length_538_cov_16.579075_g2548_i0~~NODE_2598_length_538_cov_16.579075_g2548_i0.p1  ORF type:complete len:165 (-),score=4.93 NODE_2598_length_538_cov_16.579075_g2548_i0:44-496(-)
MHAAYVARSESISCVSLEEHPTDAVLTKRRSMRRFTRGVPSCDNGETYYCGLIDILTAYEGIKVAEHAVKSLYQTNFSCIPAADYRKRLLQFIRSVIHGKKVEKFYSTVSHSWECTEKIVIISDSLINESPVSRSPISFGKRRKKKQDQS